MIGKNVLFPRYGKIESVNLVGFHPPEVSIFGKEHDELAKDAITLINLLTSTLSRRDALCVGQNGMMAMISTSEENQNTHQLSFARNSRKLIMTYNHELQSITNTFKFVQHEVPTKYDPQFVLASIDFLNSLK